MIQKLRRFIEYSRTSGIRAAVKQLFSYIRRSSIKTYPICIVYKRHSGESDADINKVIWVNPNQIYLQNRTTFPNELHPGQVYAGLWDKHHNPLNAKPKIKSLKNRFLFEKKWENTEYFDKLVRDYVGSDKNDWRGIETKDDAMDLLYEWENLYSKIKREGYRSQRELAQTDEYQPQLSLLQVDSLPEEPAKNEIGVNIGRNGEFIWYKQGQHRLAIAQILNIKSVPVRVIARHKKWQKVREDVKSSESVDKLSARSRKYLSHPDLQDILTYSLD